VLHEHGLLPVYYFPEEDLRADLLEPSDHRTTCPHKGEARHWSVRAGDRLAQDAVWGYPDPVEGARMLAGLRAVHWDAMDEWLEEGEQVIVHLRDPYHRVDVLATPRHVRISREGELLAETRRAKVIFETSLPPRWYIPEEDVRMERLRASDTRTGCAYKGFAGYWHVRVGDRELGDLAWTYREPRHDAEPIRGMLAFFNEHVDIELDGELQERPVTQWSSPPRVVG
jgi:uncharacterized protein (DUF427 family)